MGGTESSRHSGPVWDCAGSRTTLASQRGKIAPLVSGSKVGSLAANDTMHFFCARARVKSRISLKQETLLRDATN